MGWNPRHTPSVSALLRCLITAAGLLPWALLLAGQASLCFKPAFHMFCHQLPERTLSIHGVPMLVCSRCAGIYLGVALGALLPSPRWLPRLGCRLMLLAGAAMTVDVITQDLGLHAPIHAVRLLTGLALGWTASAFLFAVLKKEKPVGHGETIAAS